VLVTVSGLPGSGTSTVARAVAEALGVPRLDGGTVFRSLARERGLDLVAFSRLAEADPAIDLALDRRLAQRATEGGVVLESRLAGHIATNEGLFGAVRVWVACDEDERARRVGAREGAGEVAALAANRTREASERSRYRQYYGIDLDDLSVYDLLLDSTTTPPPDLVAQILAAAGGTPAR
jgi:cytidylate kinase